MKTKQLKEQIDIPENVQIEVAGHLIKVKGPLGESQKKLINPKIKFSKEDKKFLIISSEATKREKTIIKTFKAHVKNLIKGVMESYTYKLKVCTAHFPVDLSIKENTLIIKNFLGERKPRVAKIISGVDVKIDNEILTVSGINKEDVGQTAATIEQTCRITNRDRRVFQDGIFITEKDGKELR